MKKLITLLAILSTGLISCTKDNASPAGETNDLAVENAIVVATGNFSFSSEASTGSAKIYRQQTGKYVLGLENMNLNVGTSVFIFLSLSKTGPFSGAIKISSVLNLNGNIFKALPSNIDFALYKYLIIETEISEEIVGSAELN